MKFTFPPNSTPLAGYQIKRGIHRGGFGEVYYAHTDAGKEVALKLLQSQMEVELRGVRQCLNLKHPNLVSLYDIRIDDDGDHWIVMEYVSGRNLADVVDDHPDGLPLEDVVLWMDGMAAGIDFLHDRGIVHRDLKPGNVFVEHGLVKIGDIGLSKYISQSRRNEQTQSVGTVYYMAPEVAHGRYGREVDVYSLGIVLYELLTGRVPFEGESTGEILMKHLSETPNLDAVDPRFRPIIAKALEKDPARRTSSAGELAAAFSKAAASSVRRSQRRTLVGAGVGAESASVASTPIPVHVLPDVSDLDVTLPGPPEQTSANGSDSSANTTPLRWLFGHSDRRLPPLLERKPWLPVAGFALLLALIFIPGFVLFCVLLTAGIFGVRKAIETWGPKSEPAVEAVATATDPPRTQCVVRHRPSELLAPDTLRTIPFRQRIVDLSGALTYAAPLTALAVLGVVFVSPLLNLAPRHVPVDAGMIGHFGLVTLLGSWAILATAKLFEGARVNGLHRRLGYFLVGSLVGVAAFGLHQTLFVQMYDGFARRPDALFERLPGRSLIDAGYQPTLHGYMLFFGLLFAVRRWWWHVDGLRPWRFRLWTVGVTSLAAFFVCSTFAFPHVWGTLWAASICCVTQLAAPWMSHEERRELTRGRANV